MLHRFLLGGESANGWIVTMRPWRRKYVDRRQRTVPKPVAYKSVTPVRTVDPKAMYRLARLAKPDASSATSRVACTTSSRILSQATRLHSASELARRAGSDSGTTAKYGHEARIHLLISCLRTVSCSMTSRRSSYPRPGRLFT